MMTLRRIIIIIMIISFMILLVSHECLFYYSTIISVDAAATFPSSSSSSSFHKKKYNPYQTLGINPHASMDDIKKQYHTLCLKYHPDKNRHLSKEHQKRAEEMFKKVQEAYTQINNQSLNQNIHDNANEEEDTTRYNTFDPYSQQSWNYESMFHPSTSTRFYRYPYTPTGTSTTIPQDSFFPFLFQRPISSSSFFSPMFESKKTVSSSSNTSTGPKSIFIQRVVIPLEELYQGKQEKILIFKEYNFIQRYIAAFRGGVGTILALQGIFTSLPLLFRAGFLWTFLFFLATFHLSLPRPTQSHFITNLQEGWKEGTKLTFHSMIDPDIDVVFIIVEGKHERFRRKGDDLHTSITISKKQARQGTTLTIEPIIQSSEKEDPILLTIKPGEIEKSGQRIIIPGRGWPKRRRKVSGDKNLGSHTSTTPLDNVRGNLVVSFHVASDRKIR